MSKKRDGQKKKPDGDPPAEADTQTHAQADADTPAAPRSCDGAPDAHPEFDALLHHIRATRGFDFTVYKRNTLWRRFNRRLAELNLDSFAEYQDVLQNRPHEFQALFDTFLINVTDFFRDPEAWQTLADQVLPAITEDATMERPVRVWLPGCSTGQEAYTVALMLAEVMDNERFSDGTKVYATDLDYPALEKARRGEYTDKELEAIPDDLREKYMKKVRNGYAFTNGICRAVIFGKHDLLHDAPISRLDLLICRNTLMYFNADTQSGILARFHFALNPNGILFLGRAEMLLTHANLFTPVNLNHRIFRKVPGAMPDTRLRLDATRAPQHEPLHRSALEAGALEIAPDAVVLLDTDRRISAINRHARVLFKLGQPDVGKAFQDIELSYRPAELRSVLDKVARGHQPVTVADVQWEPPDGEAKTFRIHVAPLLGNDGGVLGTLVIFRDETECHRLEKELEQSRSDLQAAYEELQATNEELETTNEELQSSNEELETTNEELQSSNEELETTNEELQATNEELKTMNDQLRSRTDELDDANAFLVSVLDGLWTGVVVVDEEMQIERWNDRAAELWGLREDEVVGQHLMNLDIGLEVETLHKAIRRVLSGEVDCEQKTMDAVNRRGQAIRCRIRIQPRTDAQDNLCGAILLMEDVGEDTARAGDDKA